MWMRIKTWLAQQWAVTQFLLGRGSLLPPDVGKASKYDWTDYGNHLVTCELGCTQDTAACVEGKRLWKLSKTRRARL
jgi:hypothetical protein